MVESVDDIFGILDFVEKNYIVSDILSALELDMYGLGVWYEERREYQRCQINIK